MLICNWCQHEGAVEAQKTAFWELPDGTRAVEITNVPSIQCPNCEMTYIDDDIIDEIEDQFMLIDTEKLPNSFTYQQFMNQPKLLKKNYFKF
ncbi:YokU family protein [Evansella vedderi]|uniref:YokU family protein n=1 Tax=Evansella vedderi TaxID=38282 RepID=UPI00351FE527